MKNYIFLIKFNKKCRGQDKTRRENPTSSGTGMRCKYTPGRREMRSGGEVNKTQSRPIPLPFLITKANHNAQFTQEKCIMLVYML